MRVALCLFFSLLLLCGGAVPTRGSDSDFSDRGKIDFDTVMQLLNPYGTWSKIDGLWAYTPLDHAVPYTSGRWLYTEYGWYWAGTHPYSWVTEHYGYWKRGGNHLWAWFPADTWLPQIVEMRSTTTHIGWRCAEVDDTGAFVEDPADRYAKVDEWSFVGRARFAQPISPRDILSPDNASKLLDDSAAALHTYLTYRAISRPGPHPADFAGLGAESGMLAPPMTAAPMVAPRTFASALNQTPNATNGAPAGGSSTNAAPPMVDENGRPADPRQVSYWITMSLPTLWTPRPDDARPNEIYLYRPDIYQDRDGIERRISLWLNPKTRSSLGDLRNVLSGGPKTAPAAAPPGSGTPAVPADVPESKSAFRSPFDESYHHAPDTASPAESSKVAPSGLSAPATNAAPSATP